jgi:hypothetical protein
MTHTKRTVPVLTRSSEISHYVTVHLPDSPDYYAFRLLENLYFNITSKELSSSFLLFHKIQEFCSSHA